MLINKFFENTLGRWESHRTYMYPSSNKIKNLTTYFEWCNPEVNVYKVIWESVEGKGSMSIYLKDDNSFKRDVGYFTDENTESIILSVSPINLYTQTTYNGMTFKESIDFLDSEHRTRRTIGYRLNKDLSKGKVFLSGSYQEFRID